VPGFIAAPGETDILLAVTALVIAAAILGFGLLFLRLHTLPERVAHRSQKVQFQVVAILGLLALFTHNHAFWVAGLVLAFVDLPDFGTPLRQIASSMERMAGTSVARVHGEPTSEAVSKTEVARESETITSAMEHEVASSSGRPKVRAEA
jgi:multisubunit Na+/H+ antiporter MnhF subunit